MNNLHKAIFHTDQKYCRPKTALPLVSCGEAVSGFREAQVDATGFTKNIRFFFNFAFLIALAAVFPFRHLFGVVLHFFWQRLHSWNIIRIHLKKLLSELQPEGLLVKISFSVRYRN